MFPHPDVVGTRLRYAVAHGGRRPCGSHSPARQTHPRPGEEVSHAHQGGSSLKGGETRGKTTLPTEREGGELMKTVEVPAEI